MMEPRPIVSLPSLIILALNLYLSHCFMIFRNPSERAERSSLPPLGGVVLPRHRFIRTDRLAYVEADDNNESSNEVDSTKSLLDLSLEADPFWNNTRIPFVVGESYIDCKLAFTVDLDGVTYGIGVPFDHAAAIMKEDADGSVTYLSPDNDDNEELMEIMAAQLHETVSSDVALKRTPRVLTIAGPLERYIDEWEKKLTPKPVSPVELLDSSDESVDYFRTFMRQELGDDEYERALNETDEGDLVTDLLSLFEDPESDAVRKELEEMGDIFESLLSGSVEAEKFPDNLGNDPLALKLVSYIFVDGKSYSLVKLLKPFTLVARYLEGSAQFELLSAQESSMILPRLEAVCERDLDFAYVGNSFS